MVTKILHLVVIVLVGVSCYTYGKAEGSAKMAELVADPLWGCIKLLGGQFKKNGKPE